MSTLIRHKLQKARKDYDCQSSDWLKEYLCDAGTDGLSISDMRIIVKARKNDYKIKKGDLYDYCFMRSDDNEAYSFRSIPDVHQLCLKHEMYPDC